jgi:hypothetical protein
MSKIDSLKQQYPELGMSVIDILARVDTSKTNKYLPLLCKLFSSRWNRVEKDWRSEDIQHTQSYLEETKGIKVDGLSLTQQYFIYSMMDILPANYFNEFKQFQEYMERGMIENKDVLTYSTIEEVQQATSLAIMKASTKDLEKQVFKVYEDEVWLIVRPLTFEASAKYGAGTKWCTTSMNDKQYFTRYWSKGTLAYIVNKQTGLKYAMFHALRNWDKELSFWDAVDNRIDFLSMDIDEKLTPIVKQLIKEDKANEDLCDEKLADSVWQECDYKEWSQRQLRKLMKETGTDHSFISTSLHGETNLIATRVHQEPPPYPGTEESIQVTREQLERLINEHISLALQTRPTPTEIPQEAAG